MSTTERYSQPMVSHAEHYPLICLDIDGVCSPIGQNPRFHCHGPPPGFVDCGASAQVHPALPAWVAELDRAFRGACWISSWQGNCAWFAQSANAMPAVNWPYIDIRLGVGDTGIGCKLDALAKVTDPHAAVAVVDDHLAGQFYGMSSGIPRPSDRSLENWDLFRGESARKEIDTFLGRPGPTLLVGPASEVGMTRRLVDLLCRFANDPLDSEFAERRVVEADVDWWIQWPAPLDPVVEDPVRVATRDEQAWLDERVRRIEAWKAGYDG